MHSRVQLFMPKARLSSILFLKVTLVAFLVFSASFSSSVVVNSLSDNSAKRAMLTF